MIHRLFFGIVSFIFLVLCIHFFLIFYIVFEHGKWMILEPIMMVEVSTPTEFQGSIISQITKRNGIIVSTNEQDGYFVLSAEVRKRSIIQFLSTSLHF